MAKAIYVGVQEPAYLSTDIANTTVYKEVTGSFDVLRGFKIKFKPQLNNNGWQHVLNLGGTGNNTILCLALNNGKISFEHSPNLIAAYKQFVFPATAYTIGQLLEVEFLVDPTTYIGTCKINGVTYGTLQMDSTAAAVNNSLTMFNCEQNSAQRRPTQIDWYSLEIYNGNTLTTTYTPYRTTQAAILTHQASGGLDIIIPINNVVYHGAQNKAHKVTKIYVGNSNNQARNVVVGYVGNSNDEAGCFFGTPTPSSPPFTSWQTYNFKSDGNSLSGYVAFMSGEDLMIATQSAQVFITYDYQGIQKQIYADIRDSYVDNPTNILFLKLYVGGDPDFYTAISQDPSMFVNIQIEPYTFFDQTSYRYNDSPIPLSVNVTPV